jgi:SAM-dependent methyltransferase
MASVIRHYDTLLAPIYSWMVAGPEAAFANGEADLAGVIGRGGFAIDLGAGFGMHAVPLARAGWRVLAIDSSPVLLQELATFAGSLGVRTHRGDLLDFTEQLAAGERADLVLCMGDTLTHLESAAVVDALGHAVTRCLAPGGHFIATFRDYTRLPAGTARFIPVRADDNRILTCFLEEFHDHVQVHDLLHERIDGSWTTKVSSYRKLRLSPDRVRDAFAATGLEARIEPGPRGMVMLTAVAG